MIDFQQQRTLLKRSKEIPSYELKVDQIEYSILFVE